jgi:hypothetical protein
MTPITRETAIVVGAESEFGFRWLLNPRRQKVTWWTKNLTPHAYFGTVEDAERALTLIDPRDALPPDFDPPIIKPMLEWRKRVKNKFTTQS